MQISVRVSDMIDSYQKYLETKLGCELGKRQTFTKNEDDKEQESVQDYGFVRFGTANEKFKRL